MIISKKRFKQEVERKARKLREAERVNALVRGQDKRIRELNFRVVNLEDEIRHMAGLLEETRRQQAGTIKGFYQDKNGGVQIINGTIEVPASCTEGTEIPNQNG